MSKPPVPKVSKKALDNAVKELSDLDKEIRAKTKRLKELRTKMADLFHTGEDGTFNTEIHGYEVKVVRKMGISIEKDAKEQLESDKPDTFAELFPEKIVRSMDNKFAKENLDNLEDYLTTKQGLPTITIKEIE